MSCLSEDFLNKYPHLNQKFQLKKQHFPKERLNQNVTQKQHYLIVKSQKQPTRAVIFEQNIQKKIFPDAHAWIYQGQYRQETTKSGIGHMLMSSGDTYEGEWENNCPNGEGTYIGDQYTYKGRFVNGEKYGLGQIKFNRQNVGEDKSQSDSQQTKFQYIEVVKYEGNFRNDSIEGMGTVFYSNGDTYHGQMSKGEPNGQGTYLSALTKYQGTWVSGKMEGSGKCQWFSKSGSQKVLLSSYTGEYKDGQKHGFGEYVMESGKIYRGNWFQGKFKPDLQAYISS